jgi:high affinity Mn2+ porin
MTLVRLWRIRSDGIIEAASCVAGAAVLTALLLPLPAVAADPPTTPSGFYVGGHVGYGFGNATATLSDPIGGASSGGTA